MEALETTFLLNRDNGNRMRLSVFFAMVCVIDIFGVFPIITLPKAIINCGYYGIPVVVTVCSAQIYTATLLGRSWVVMEDIQPQIRRKNRYPYSALAEITYGKRFASVVNFVLDLTIFTCGIPNLIVASQNLQLLGLRISENSVDITDCYWMIVVGLVLCPVLWLGSPKDMKCVCTLSMIMVLSVFALTTYCLISSNSLNDTEIIPSTSDIPLWKSILTTYGIIAFQFDIHPSILTIQVDMRDKSKLPKAIILAYIVTLSMLGITTVAAAIKYGTNTQHSILETLPSSFSSHVAALLTTAQLCLTSVVSNNALYQHMEDCLCISRDFNAKRCILRTILTIMAVVLAESVPRFDLVMSLIGGTLTGPLMFVLPPLFYVKVLKLQSAYEEQMAMQSFNNIVFSKDDYSTSMSKYIQQRFREDLRSSSPLMSDSFQWRFSKRCETVLCIFIILISSLATVTTTYISLGNLASSYSDVSKPCIYNVSSALLYL